MTVALLRRIAYGTRIPDRVFDSADEPKPAARKFSDVDLEGDPLGVILRAIDFRAPGKPRMWDQTF
jgi:hypothetical protein